MGGLLFSVAFTAFLTGITEPIEFTFLFLAPMLYVIHAILAGVSMVVVNYFGILHGFGFSAGLIDYILNWGLATKPSLLIPIGLVFGVVYFAIFYFSIKIFNIKTPGREDDVNYNQDVTADAEQTSTGENSDLEQIAIKYLEAAGGKDNITNIEACITRLRLTVKDSALVDLNKSKALGAKGVVKLGKTGAQIIIGPQAEKIADAMKKLI